MRAEENERLLSSRARRRRRGVSAGERRGWLIDGEREVPRRHIKEGNGEADIVEHTLG